MADNEVSITETVNEVTISVTENSVRISSPGPQGPPGPQGSPGSSAGFYFALVFTSANPVVVNHNLAAYPGVEIIVSGEEVEADVVHNSVNQLTVTFSGPTSGTIVCS